jgi:hypothetical protein
MQFPPRIHRRVRHADFLDFFEIKEPFAVEQSVEGHHAEGSVEDGEREGHGDTSFAGCHTLWSARSQWKNRLSAIEEAM